MLTKYDEWTCHQTVSTFDHPHTSDRAWTEKLWCNLHDTSGKLVLATGLGVYPNRNVMDGYACVNVENREQTNLRFSRELRPRIDELSVGPLSWEIVEPFRKLHLNLAENNQGISFDLEFLGRMQPGEEEPHFGRSRGRTFVNHCRYSQLGRARGKVTVDGKTFELNEDSFFAQRDHSWGIRMGVGAPEQGVQMADIDTFTDMMINWLTVQFSDWGLSCYLIEKGDGRVERLTGARVRRLDDGKQPVPVVAVEHQHVYHDNSPRMKSGRMVFTLADGEKVEMEMKELTTMYLRGGGYIGVKDFFHGLWMGESWQDGEKWNVADPKEADEVHGLNDTVIEVKCGNETGYGIIENLILPPFPKYGF